MEGIRRRRSASRALTTCGLPVFLTSRELVRLVGLDHSRLTLIGEIAMKKLFVKTVKTERVSREVVAACRNIGCCGK